MSTCAPPSSLDPRSSRVVPLTDPVAMPSPPPLAPPAAAEEDKKRPLPPTKMKELFPYALYCVFGGMGRTGAGMAFVGLHIVLCVVKVLTFTTDPEEARFWAPIFRVVAYLCFAATVLMTCVCIRCYKPVDGVYAVKFDPPEQQQATAAVAAAEQLPPPPPEMDMC